MKTIQYDKIMIPNLQHWNVLVYLQDLFITGGYAVAMHIFKKWVNSRSASVTAQDSFRDCDSAYLTK